MATPTLIPMRARVPASSANLGPGFDALGVALSLYLEVTVDEATSFAITSEGCGAGMFDTPDHLAARIVRDVLGHDRFAVHISSDIPLSRGLGSSASLALAAAAAAGADDPLRIACEVDGHAENAAASLLGGLVVAATHGDDVIVRSLPLDDDWQFVVVIPEVELATSEARRVLPETVPFGDAVRNVGAMGLLIAGLANREDFVAAAMDDALHQPYRMGLLPFSRPLLDAMREAGAAGSCWSGAGSTMLGLVTAATAAQVVEAATTFVNDHGVAADVRLLTCDRTGLVLNAQG